MSSGVGAGLTGLGQTVLNNDTTQIINPLDSPELSIITATDPEQIRLYREQIATQMNQQSQSQKGLTCVDLSNRIADIRIETSAQGSSILEIDVIDPYLMLFAQNEQGVSFIDVADDGYLDPPIDINFPSSTNCIWRLCAVRPTLFATQPTTLTFEDVNASILREVDPNIGKACNPSGTTNSSTGGQTLGEWMQGLVDTANKAIAKGPANGGVDAPPGRVIEVAMWIAPYPQDPNAPKSSGSHFNQKTSSGAEKQFAKDLQSRAADAATHALQFVGNTFSLDPNAPPPSTGIGHRQTG